MDAAEIDRELGDLEVRMEQLRSLYEQYFMGFDRLEPTVHRRDVERRVGVLRREQIRNTAQRFKFNCLVQRLNTMQQHWARIVREIENGTYKRDVMRAAARFGGDALGGLGKKKAKQLAAAIARDQQTRKVEDAYELDADDLIEEPIEEPIEEEAPTPPRPLTSPPPAARPAAPASPPAEQPPAAPAPAPAARPAPLSGLGMLSRLSAGAKKADQPQGAAAPKSPIAAPRSPFAAPQNIASSALRAGPAAAKPVTAQPAPARAAAGGLDLDLDDGPPAGPASTKPTAAAPPPSARSQPLVAKPVAPAQPVTMGETPKPPAQPVTMGETPKPPAQPAPQAPPPAGPSPSAPAPAPRVTPGVPGARPVPAAATPPRTAGPVHAAPRVPAPAPPGAPPPAAGDLNEQRIRQIYAKYVEAKRSTQESTAGITYDKLAQSLRVQTEKLRSAHPSKTVDYEVVVKDGKTHLKPVLK